MYEFIKQKTATNPSNRAINIKTVSKIFDGEMTQISVLENIGTLFSVSINGIAQAKDVHYTHDSKNYSSVINFFSPPYRNSKVTVQYYKGINSVILDNTGKLIQFLKEDFVYDGSTLVFNVSQSINSLMTVETNGLAEKEGVGYNITTGKQITYLEAPQIGSIISISYFY